MNTHAVARIRFPLLLSALALGLISGMAAWRSPGLIAAAQTDPLSRLAAHLDIPMDRLSEAVSQEEVLLDGTRLLTVKAIDHETDRIVGASFANGRAVDRRQMIDAAGAAWRTVNGAITPGLVESLAALRDGERMRVDLWYRFDPPAILDGKGQDFRSVNDEPPTELVERLAEMRASEAAARTWSASRSSDKQAGDAPSDMAMNDVVENVPASPELAAEKGVDAPDIVISSEMLEQSRIELSDAVQRETEHREAFAASLAPVRSALLARLQTENIQLHHVSEIVPTLTIEADRRTIAALSRWPEIDALYPTATQEGVALGTAGPALNANLTRDVGYTGTGVTVSVSEWGRVFGENPFLNVTGYCRPGEAGEGHPTAVAGFVASTHDTHRGIAPGAAIVSANCADTGDLMDWGADNARVLNHSIWQGPHQAGFNTNDRRLDWIARYMFDTPVIASGNAANGCTLQDGSTSQWALTPSKGYNTIAVGNFNDGNTVAWDNDTMANCSSFGNPTGDGATGAHEKPELSAPGTALTSTTVSTDPASAVGGVGSGTSYASPMVAGMAANLMQVLPALNNRPEAIKPILMASALHNIEGASRLSDVDGAGGMVATAAIAIVERQHVTYGALSAADLPMTQYVLAKQGERVRFAVHWQTNPNAAFTTDSLPADVDLRAYRGDGTTLVAASTSVNNAFEIVEFTAPATDLYVFRIELWGTWSGGNTFFGAGWWRGVDRFENGSWYTMLSEPPPLGHHFELRPSEAPPANYWHGVALRPNSADYDLQLYNASWFENPNDRQMLSSSAYSTNALDFILVDGNHWPSANREHYRVRRWSGDGAYQLSAGKHGTLLASTADGLYGPYTLNSIQSMFIADIGFDAASMRRIKLIPAGGSNDDLGLALYRSNAGDSESWRRSRGQTVASNDTPGVGATEKFRYAHDGTGHDWLGLVVYNKTYNSDASFYLQVTASAIFSDGFDGD